MKETVTIERLLVWSYRDQLVGRMTEEVAGGEAGVGRCDAPAMNHRPRSQDPRDVSYVVVGGQGADCMSAIMALAGVYMDADVQKGLKVELSGEDVHPDALAVEASVQSLGKILAAMIRKYARFGMRPDDPDMFGSKVATHTKNGRPVKMWVSDTGEERYFAPHDPKFRVFVPITYKPSAMQVQRARDEWMLWADALAVLAGHFRSRPGLLRRYQVSESEFAAPWLDAVTKTNTKHKM